jgi:hypothetical protein
MRLGKRSRVTLGKAEGQFPEASYHLFLFAILKAAILLLESTQYKDRFQGHLGKVQGIYL